MLQSEILNKHVNGLRMSARAAGLLAFCLLLTPVALSHHSFSAEFLPNQVRTVEGTVQQVWFKSPHVRYYVKVLLENGEGVVWDSRGLSPSILLRRGWNKSTINVGDRVKVTGNLGRDGRKLLYIINIEMADGTVHGKPYAGAR